MLDIYYTCIMTYLPRKKSSLPVELAAPVLQFQHWLKVVCIRYKCPLCTGILVKDCLARFTLGKVQTPHGRFWGGSPAEDHTNGKHGHIKSTHASIHKTKSWRKRWYQQKGSKESVQHKDENQEVQDLISVMKNIIEQTKRKIGCITTILSFEDGLR